MALTRDQMARRVAREIRDGDYVNLGIGIPTLVANHVPRDIQVMLQSENGLLGMGPFPTEAEVEEIVETGSFDPDAVHLAGIYVHRIVLNAHPEKRIEQRTVRKRS